MTSGTPSGAFATRDPAEAVVALLAAAQRGARAGATTVLAVDGPSGSGKSTFAERLIRAVGTAVGPASALRMDDLYPGWDGLADAVPLLVDQVLAPLAEGRPAAYRRYDWHRARYAESHPVPAGGWVVVEGAGCGSRAAAPYLSALAWVDAPRHVRMARGLARDGETYRPHWERWERQELALFAAEATAGRADVRLDTGPAPG